MLLGLKVNEIMQASQRAYLVWPKSRVTRQPPCYNSLCLQSAKKKLVLLVNLHPNGHDVDEPFGRDAYNHLNLCMDQLHECIPSHLIHFAVFKHMCYKHLMK